MIKLARGDRGAANTAAARANETVRLTLIVWRFAAELLHTMQSTEIPPTQPFLKLNLIAPHDQPLKQIVKFIVRITKSADDSV